MSYRTLEVEVEDGRVRARGGEPLPTKARALLTILESHESEALDLDAERPGLRRFLSRPPLKLTEEQFRTGMEADFWDQ